MKKILSTLFIVFSTQLFSQSQSELLKDVTATSLIPASVVSNKLEIKAKEWPVTINREGDIIASITLLRAGILEEKFQPDVAKYSSYFYNANTRLCYIENVFVYYTMNSGTPTISYLLSDTKEKLLASDPKIIKDRLVDYFYKASIEQKGAKENLKEDLAQQKEKEKLQNSLKGKSIKSLEIVWLTDENKTGMQSKIQFGVKAIDASGKVFSTDNLGGKTSWEDFIIESVGAVTGDEYLTTETDASKIKDDKVVLTVKNKFNPSQYTTSSIAISYSTPVKLEYFGKSGCPALTCCTGTRGYPGKNIVINACNSTDGKYVLAEVIVEGQLMHKLKVKKEIPVYIDATGGPGCSGHSESSGQGGKGGDGASGGNVTINKTPTLTGDNFIIYNNGGKGGKGGKGKTIDGPQGKNGMPGNTQNNYTNVKLNF